MNTAFLERIEKALSNEGFSQDLTFTVFPKRRGQVTQSAFSMYRNTDAEIVGDSTWNLCFINGYSLYVNTVNRHNGTDTNVNVDITISKFKNGLGQRFEVPEGAKKSVRINQNCSDRVFEKRIATIVDVYNKVIECNK